MSFTPFARARNFTLDNLKMYLKMYPDLLYDASWGAVKESLEDEMKGYSRTYYQQACQLGLEDHSDQNIFQVQKYLGMFSDEDLKKYLNFWFKVYYTPNPYVKSSDNDSPVILFCEVADHIVNAESHKIDFDFVHNEICGDGKSFDIEYNLFKTYGTPIRALQENGKKYLFVENEDVSLLEQLIKKIRVDFPIEAFVDKKTFFDRFSYKNYAKFYGIAEQKIEELSEVSMIHESNASYNADDKAELLKFSWNRIIFGAPGTGKSYLLECDRKKWFDVEHYERVTFYPGYSYGQFFGCYKPVGNKGEISYDYIPGPFLRMLLKSISDPSDNYLLLIEEINRADVAAAFGDVFQLLDRKHGISEYSVDISNELQKYILEHYTNIKLSGNKLYIPANLYIWATMNNADQGVMPLDTAFKRRWDFEHLSIDAGEQGIESYFAVLQLKSDEVMQENDRETAELKQKKEEKIYWNTVRHQINMRLRIAGLNEDKWLGPFFLSTETLQDEDLFLERFQSKVLMYLFEDAAKYSMSVVFGQEYASYTELCLAFQKQGTQIFSGFGDTE